MLPVFVFDRALLHHPEPAPARVAFMLDCLHHLDLDLRQRGGRLILRYGDPVEILPQLIRETQADGIYAYIDYERIYGRVRDARLNQALTEQGMKIRWFEAIASTPDSIPHSAYCDRWYKDIFQIAEQSPLTGAKAERSRQKTLKSADFMPLNCLES